MKTDSNFHTKDQLEYVIDTHSSIIESHNVHPAFRIAEKIYSSETSSFFDNLSSPEKLQNSPQKKPLSMTPVPMRYYRDSNTRSGDKEDIFFNPTAFYLSKKPLAINKFSRERQRKKHASLISPVKRECHKKTMSYNTQPKKYKLPRVQHSPLIPIEEVKAVSPRLGFSQSNQAKEVHCEALSRIADYCENTISKPSPSLAKEQKIANKYSEKMGWISDVLQSYGEYDYRIIDELFKYSSDSRQDLENERAKVVNMMKTGAYDPNRNVVKLRARIKKKKERVGEA